MAGPQGPRIPEGPPNQILAQRPPPMGRAPLEWNQTRQVSKNMPTADPVKSQLAEEGKNMFSVPDNKIALDLLQGRRP